MYKNDYGCSKSNINISKNQLVLKYGKEKNSDANFVDIGYFFLNKKDLINFKNEIGIDFGSHILNAEKPEWLYLPVGIAHGMITLEDEMIMLYKVDNLFDPKKDTFIK